MNDRTHLVLVALAAGLLAACGNGQTSSPPADAAAAAFSAPTERAAYAVTVSGSVLQLEGSDFIEIQPGQSLANRTRITVAEDAQIDIQFGRTAIARVRGPAEFIVRTAAGERLIPIMGIDLVVGAVSARVQPLAQADSFSVRSENALYAVRGTEFHVDTLESESITVAEGAVAILPRSLELSVLRAALASDDPVRELLDALEAAAPVVRAGERRFIDLAEMDAANAVANRIAAQLTGSTAPQGESLVAELREAVAATRERFPHISTPASATPEEIAAELSAVGETSLLPVPDDPQMGSLLGSEEATSLVSFTLRTLPQNAQIYIDGTYVGTSIYRAVLRANQSLSIQVAKVGYREQRIEVDRARSEVLTVQLERLPPSISAESFLQAIAADDLATVRTYVQEGGSVDVRTADGVPALVLASGIVPVLSGQLPDLSYDREIVRTIVAAGANLETPFVVEGSTFRLLHAAVLAGVAGFDVSPLVETLLANGADVNGAVTLEGESLTPLAIAVRWALFTGETREELIKQLVASGANLDVTISYDDELLTLREIAERLVEQGEVQDEELLDLLRDAGVVS
jgi:hypothetical protein